MTSKKTVTELDFRMPEFYNAKVEDYEFRGDGKLVRKDRWQQAVHHICSLVGGSTRDFEIEDVIERIKALQQELASRACSQSELP